MFSPISIIFIKGYLCLNDSNNFFFTLLIVSKITLVSMWEVRRDNNMYNSVINTKLIPTIITKPEQGGKGKEFTAQIDDILENKEKHLCIFISPNRIASGNQTFENFKKYFENHKEQIDVLHGGKAKSKDPDGYLYRASNGQRLIMAINNGTRLKVIKKIIIGWCKKPGYKVELFIDESGKNTCYNTFVKHIWRHLEGEIDDLHDRFDGGKSIHFIDAHTGNMLESKKFNKCFPSGIMNIHKNIKNLEGYTYIKDMNFTPRNWGNTFDILKSITQGDIEIIPTDYIFWVFPYKKNDQYCDGDNIANVFAEQSIPFCLVIVNGEGFHVWSSDMPNNNKVLIKKTVCGKKKSCNTPVCTKCNPDVNTEYDQILAIKKKYGYNKALILAGHDCVDRGITYIGQKMTFTKAFFSRQNLMDKNNFGTGTTSDKNFSELKINSQEDISQMYKRIAGSCYTDSCRPIIYGPIDIHEGIIELEKVSSWIATSSMKDEDQYITLEMYNEIRQCLSQGIEPRNLLDGTECEKHVKTSDTPNIFISVNRIDYKIDVAFYKGKAKEVRKIFSGGEHVSADRAITTRWNSKSEQDANVGLIMLNTIKTDYPELKKVTCRHNTKGMLQFRLRFVKDSEQNDYFVDVISTPANTVILGGVMYNIKQIEKDGNCIFGSCMCFPDMIPDSIKSKKKPSKALRTKLKNYLITNMDKYNDAGEYEDDVDWDEACEKIGKDGIWNEPIGDILVQAISDYLKININIFVCEQLENGNFEYNSYHELKPNPDIAVDKTMYIMKVGNHYNALIKE